MLASRSSYGSPSWVWCISWVTVSWISELTIMILLVEVTSHSVCNSEEVFHEIVVADVSVEVILEVLEHVHVLLDESVLSNSWEREGTVIELPGVNLERWGLSLLLFHGLGDVLHIGPVSWVEGSREHVDLIVKFFLSLIKIYAWVIEFDVLFIGVGG